MSFIGDILGGVLGSNAAGNAASALQQGAGQAEGALNSGQQAALGAITGATSTATSNLQPYTSLGSTAANSLLGLLQGGSLSTPIQQFQAPTNVTMTNDPGYQFRLNQGIQALTNANSATGNLLSGNQLQGLSDYTQNSASQEYQNVYNRAQQTYNTNFNTQAYNQNAAYQRLMGLTGIGQSSTTGLNNILLSGAGMQTNTDLSTAGALAGQYNNAAAARASGIIGANNAWQGALGGLTNIGQDYASSSGSIFNQSGSGFMNFLGML